MNSLVVYDSAYGNTEKIAKAIAEALNQFSKTKLLPANKVNISDLDSIDTLIVGSPTQGGRPTQAVQKLINELRANSLKDIKIAAFDTRFAKDDHGFGLKLLMKTIGFAAPKITRSLQQKGGQQALEPEGFIVSDKEGPLNEGEIQRAIAWAKKLRDGRSSQDDA